MVFVLLSLLPLLALIVVCVYVARQKPEMTGRYLAILSLFSSAEAIWLGYFASHAKR